MEQRECWIAGNFLHGDGSMVGRQSPATPSESDHPMGRGRRPVPRRSLPWGDIVRFRDNWWAGQVFANLRGPAETYNPDAMALNWNWEIMRNRLDTGFYKGVQAEWDK